VISDQTATFLKGARKPQSTILNHVKITTSLHNLYVVDSKLGLLLRYRKIILSNDSNIHIRVSAVKITLYFMVEHGDGGLNSLQSRHVIPQP
jgi:hypothetical protein